MGVFPISIDKLVIHRAQQQFPHRKKKGTARKSDYY
jgi:hypothetical protein